MSYKLTYLSESVARKVSLELGDPRPDRIIMRTLLLKESNLSVRWSAEEMRLTEYGVTEAHITSGLDGWDEVEVPPPGGWREGARVVIAVSGSAMDL